MLCVIVPTGAMAQRPHGGTAYEEEPPPPPMLEPGLWTGPEVPGTKAVLLEDGTAAAPADAPEQVKQAIWAANSLQELPYSYGGGHNLKFDVGEGADCSGTVSFALHAAGPAQDPAGLRLVHEWGRGAGATGSRSSRTPATRTSKIAGLRLDTSVAGMRAPRRRSPPRRSSAARAGARWPARRAAS